MVTHTAKKYDEPLALFGLDNWSASQHAVSSCCDQFRVSEGVLIICVTTPYATPYNFGWQSIVARANQHHQNKACIVVRIIATIVAGCPLETPAAQRGVSQTTRLQGQGKRCFTLTNTWD
eukprot:3068961-Pyramimonas_sp.AAC.2